MTIGRTARRSGAGADPRAGDAGGRGRPSLRSRAGIEGAADLRRAGVRAAAPRPGAGRRRRGRHARAGPSITSAAARSSSRDWPRSCSTRPTRCSTWGSPRTSSRSWPRPRRRGRLCCSRPRCRRGSPAIARRHLKDPVRIKIGGDRVAAGTAPKVRQVAYIVPKRAQACGAGARARHRGAVIGDRLLPATHRGGRAGRDAQRPRLPRRGAARRHDPGAAEPRDEAVPDRRGRPADRHRRRRAGAGYRAPLARRQLRRPLRAGIVRAPDRPRGSGGTGRGRDHAGRARASTASCRGSSGPHGRRSRSPGCRQWPTFAPGGWRSRGPPCARRSSPATSTTSGSWSSRWPTNSTSCRWPSPP